MTNLLLNDIILQAHYSHTDWNIVEKPTNIYINAVLNLKSDNSSIHSRY